ncbi:4-hydroxy-tetrahydrodipicolinate synthase [Lacticaseibacillus sharpeae]|uniref:4-hydroxy-tetrahydrodipicolinate synthase n=1 Tax=Lacticaseibacillus sharpeae JCM 1186 = DSM 20505 TaxID=1291052 RepID=A0A0R1ZK47_9LACO|nr:4-hydroxy-tetrahydrodipicolinate synthase [Lacticaseibacillus sharpeae]KRM55293.1 dihydrodipicolinate synthase [Lacticaseibacillus sharpeae JCM 1186 = DSM 20505]
MFKNVPIITALVTPFTTEDEVDYPALDALIERMLGEGVTGFLVAGTTGESPNLTHAEKIALFTHVGELLKGKNAVQVANVGTNSTAASAALAKEASAIAGVDALLAVAPYYNKPSQAGMIAHFTKIADASSVPVILYNIPGRVVVTIDNDTIVELAKHPRIKGVKQCTTIDDIAYLVKNTPDDFAVYTGEDGQMLDAIRVGGAGVISVASHVLAPEMLECLTAESAEDIASADELMDDLTPKMNALFRFPSPEPIKMLLAHRGEINEDMRLPMIKLTADEAAQVLERI